MIWRLRGKCHAAVKPVGRHGDSPDANERAAALRASIGRALLRIGVERAESWDAAACTLQLFVLQGNAGPPPARGRAPAVEHAPA
jgi:hypothetical protein